MEIILLKNYEGLGEAGDVVSVKPGFARNKLIPEGVALRASKRNMAIAEEKKPDLESKENSLKESSDKEQLSDQVDTSDSDNNEGSDNEDNESDDEKTTELKEAE